MKNAVLFFTIFLNCISLNAQIKLPQASPRCYLNQKVGFTEVDIEYSRPSVRGRIIFGDLVPFAKLWRTGANENTTIYFGEDVTIAGKILKKGKYSIYSLPKADIWEIYFYSTTNNWGLPEVWDESKIVMKTTAKPEMLPKSVENLTIGLSNMDMNAANLDIIWERTLVSIKFEVSTNKTALESINKTLAGPNSADYFAAAQYYYQNNLDMLRALTYVNKALELGDEKPYWQNRLKSLIQYKLSDKKGAIETAKISLAGAETAKDNDYIKMNKDSIKEWSSK